MFQNTINQRCGNFELGDMGLLRCSYKDVELSNNISTVIRIVIFLIRMTEALTYLCHRFCQIFIFRQKRAKSCMAGKTGK